MVGGTVFFIYFPAIFGFVGILLIASGIMDDKLEYTLGGIGLFFAAGILPFIILPSLLGI
ncbi:MAG: hypothetical protein QMD61_01340 [Methanobacterium sp.]|nr:hypothetical protein [Methanobacterium sp.]